MPRSEVAPDILIDLGANGGVVMILMRHFDEMDGEAVGFEQIAGAARQRDGQRLIVVSDIDGNWGLALGLLHDTVVFRGNATGEDPGRSEIIGVEGGGVIDGVSAAGIAKDIDAAGIEVPGLLDGVHQQGIELGDSGLKFLIERKGRATSRMPCLSASGFHRSSMSRPSP